MRIVLCLDAHHGDSSKWNNTPLQEYLNLLGKFLITEVNIFHEVFVTLRDLLISAGVAICPVIPLLVLSVSPIVL